MKNTEVDRSKKRTKAHGKAAIKRHSQATDINIEGYVPEVRL
jgi:hypothetical protein